MHFAPHPSSNKAANGGVTTITQAVQWAWQSCGLACAYTAVP